MSAASVVICSHSHVRQGPEADAKPVSGPKKLTEGQVMAMRRRAGKINSKRPGSHPKP